MVDLNLLNSLQELIKGEAATIEKPRFWLLSGYSFKSDGDKIYIERVNDKFKGTEKEFEWHEVDKNQLELGVIQIIYEKN